MALMRHPVYVWIGGCCPDDCPDGGDGAVWADCVDPAHFAVHLWVREGVDGTFDPVWYRTGETSPSHPGFLSGVAVRGDMFDDIVAAWTKMRDRDRRRSWGGPRAVPDPPPARRRGASRRLVAAAARAVAAGVRRWPR